jgi:hypothetical protein
VIGNCISVIHQALVLGAAFDRHYIALVSPATAGFFPGMLELVQQLALRFTPQAGAYTRSFFSSS